jgi:hypothetical protein
MATIEMITVCLVIVVPCLLALAQLCKLDRASRELQYAAQAECIKAAMAGEADPSFRIITSSSSIHCSVLPAAAARLGGFRSRSLKRQYVIATGSGHGND